MRYWARWPGTIAIVAIVMVAVLVEIAGYAVYGRDFDALGVLVAIILVLLAAAVITLALRLRQSGTRQRLLQVERDRASFENLYERMLALARDIFVLVDPSGRVIDANAAAVEAYGYSREELLQLNVRNLRAPEALPALEEEWQAAASPEGALVETLHRRWDGSTFPVEVSSRAITVDGVPLRQSFVRDISRRRAAESDLRRLSAAYATLAATNEAIVHAPDEATLFASICRIAVEHGDYLGAWVGVADAQSERIIPVASAGSIDEYIHRLRISTDPAEHGGSRPAAIAFRNGWPSYSDDFANDPAMAPWSELATSLGIHDVGEHRRRAGVGGLRVAESVGARTGRPDNRWWSSRWTTSATRWPSPASRGPSASSPSRPFPGRRRSSLASSISVASWSP